MTNFKFLYPEFRELMTYPQEAEKNVISAPRTSLFYSRLTMEQAVAWMYDHDGDLELPYQSNIAALLSEPSFKMVVPPYIHNKLNYIRKTGNLAIHGQTNPSVKEAKEALRFLHIFLQWLANSYGQLPPKKQPFDESLLKATDEKALSQEELKKLAKELEATNLELKRKDQKIKESEEEIEKLKQQLEEYARRRKNAGPLPQPEDISEDETRRLFIDLLLKEAGWDPAAENVAEFKVTGMPNQTGTGYADYVLWGDDGLPLAVIEAKKTLVNPHDGQHQAKLYADTLESMYGQRPVIYFSNGYETWMWDDKDYPPRQVMGFYTKDELQSLFNRRPLRKDPLTVKPKEKIAGRYYQMEAVKRVCEDLKNKRRKTLLVMATGSGKTRTAAGLIDVLSRAGWAQKILFLADRTTLVTQAKNMISEQLKYLTIADLTQEKDGTSARMVFSTYPTMMNRIDGERNDGKRQFTVGHFDLVIVDEAHRSIYKKYAALFSYFDALWIGLTATPKSDIDKNTYEIFERDNHNPTFAYELDQAVEDGFLVPPKAASVPIKFPNEGITYDALSDEEKEEYEEKFYDEESGTLPAQIYPSALNDWLFNTNTVDQVLEYLMQNGLRIEGGDKLGKSIIFAKNHEHALFISERFDILYPGLKGHYLKVIDNYVSYAQSLIDDFKARDKMPQIAVSVDMLDTGVDIPDLLNLVFFKRVRSSAKFWQMVGRGTRLSPDIFGPGDDKKSFYIFDFCDNIEFFRANPEGITPKNTKSLSQRIFEARLKLSQSLPVSGEDAEYNKKFKKYLLDDLHRSIEGLNRDSISVKQNLEYVIRYSNREQWNYTVSDDMNLITQKLAHLVEYPDDETARRFDLMMLNFMLGYLRDEKIKMKYIPDLKKISQNLLNKTAIPAVNEQAGLLRDISNGSFFTGLSIKKLETLRVKLRDLVQFLEGKQKEVVYTHFEDKIMGEADWHDLVKEGTRLEGYKERVARYVREHENQFVIKKLKHNMPITSHELQQLEEFLFDGDERGTKDDLYQELGEEKPLGYFIRSIIGLDTNAAKKAFSDFIDLNSLTADQIRFVDTIINFLAKNGVIDPAMLYDSPFTDINDQSIDGVFPPDKRNAIMKVINNINNNAGVA
jgi:type I restriction enzyme R subunit